MAFAGRNGEHRQQWLRWLLAALAAASTPLLLPTPSSAAQFMTGPSVRVTPNAQVEFKWVSDVTWFGHVAIYDNPDGTGNPVGTARTEDAFGNPVAATGHTLAVNAGDAPLANDTGYFFRVTATDPTGSENPFSTPTPLPRFFTGEQAIGDVTVTPGTDRAIVAWDANVIGNGRVEILAPSGSGPFDDSDNTTDHAIELSGLEPATTYEFRVSNRHAIDGDALASKTGSFTTVPVGPTLAAEVQAPINSDGSSTLNANRGVVPLRFTLAADGRPTCDLPPATLRLTRTGGSSPGPIDEGVYSGPSDSGSDFRITDCAYRYNAHTRALGPGTYLAELLIDSTTVGDARFELT
jgi:hypothetical protein